MKKIILALSFFALLATGNANAETLKMLIPGTKPLSVLALTPYFCSKQGLEIKITQQANYSHATVVPLLAKGDFDIAIVALPSMLIAASNNVDLTIVTAVLNGGDSIVARAGINSLKDLKGKRIALHKGSGAESFFYDLLLKEGMTYAGDKPDVNVVPMPLEAMRVSYESGAVDAFIGVFPDTTDIEDAGKGKVIVEFSEYQRYLSAMKGFYSTSAAPKFYKCYGEMLATINQKPSASRDDILAKAIKFAEASGLHAELPPNRKHAYQLAKKASTSVIFNTSATLKSIGKIKQDFQVPSWFDQSYRNVK